MTSDDVVRGLLDREAIVAVCVRYATALDSRDWPLLRTCFQPDVVGEYEGCPMKAGQMVLMPLWAATRDPRQFDRADEVVLDRSPNRHIAFGAGPHRCAGAHLARRELLIALEEWHARIPDYELDTDEAPIEHGWQLGLDSLPLRWEV